MKKIRAAVIGATGYAGAELVRLLYNHPNVEITALSSVSFEGKEIAEIYPSFKKKPLPTLTNAEEAVKCADVVFASLPHGLSEPLAEACLANNALLIDLGADFRLESEEDYEEWYKKPFDKPELHGKAVYSLPELFRDAVKDAEIVANPGCYPTAAALGLAPALKNGLIKTDSIIIDAKSGVSGAGRGLTQNTHYPETNETISAYKVGVHRHTPEIEQTLSHVAGKAVKVTFVPHLLPVNRGIEETIYVKLADGVDFDKVRALYEEFYKDEQFVRLERSGAAAEIRNVTRSNFCDISLHFDKRNNLLIICSCIDNMVKGAAGQAIQNMNIKFSLPEETGLETLPSGF
ncbi:MAG: N-acetyl-gamma-glutamyl-phosphate reductase [Ruminococcaceae bacterium]|nr:N-acetyl-gamma-glutamyl-phosphate reductase [Oscillospiraceae bacterium]